MRNSQLGMWVLLTAMALCLGANAQEEKEHMDIPFEGQVAAPDFPPGMEWLNTKQPLTMKQLRGKVVLLDFWTYCCINCMHIVPDLKKLEAKYAKELVVIGVHSAKFKNEKESENIREAIKRYEIEHPVVNDKDFVIWRSYSVRAWPTLMLINPNGRVIGMHSGEGIYDLFDEVIEKTIEHFDKKGQIDRKPITFELEKDSAAPTLLAYPGKVHAHEASNRLVFSDSNHNRIVISTLDGEVKEVIGSGEIGLKDGDFAAARFFRPQGVYLDAKNELVYVADTENHAIRKIDLKGRKVTTIAGTGQQARRFNIEGKGVALNSPWDLLLHENTLYIAMAGPHQLWKLDLQTLEAKVHAGTGRENITDGLLDECALAQPSGITTDGKRLFFADSEVSAVRSADIDPKGRVVTYIGEGLFEFGDVDGTFPQARLQHPLGVEWHEGHVYVADSYNHKIKRLDPEKKELKTFIGSGLKGHADGPPEKAQLNEPSGLSFAAGKIFIADCNNHLIRVFDLKKNELSTLAWKNPEKLRMKPAEQEAVEGLARLSISPGVEKVKLRLGLPAGTKLNPAAQSRVTVKTSNGAGKDWEMKLASAEFELPVSVQSGEVSYEIETEIYYCDAGNEGRCYYSSRKYALPVQVADAGTKEEKVVNLPLK